MRKQFEANKNNYVDFVSKRICVHHAHLQLQTLRSDIIWIISNEIILLLFSFNLVTTDIIQISYQLFKKS
jgi:hypothetical protein